MNRIAVVLACGCLVSGCSYTAGLFKPGPASATLQLESEPPGSDATTSVGGSCRTPCSLPVTAAGDFTVTFTHAGYASQTVPVQFVAPQDPRLDAHAHLDPNPVYATLEAAPAAKPAVKKRPHRVAKKPAAPAEGAPAPAAAAPPPAAASPFPPPPR